MMVVRDEEPNDLGVLARTCEAGRGLASPVASSVALKWHSCRVNRASPGYTETEAPHHGLPRRFPLGRPSLPDGVAELAAFPTV